MAIAPAAPEAGLSVGLILLAIACGFLLALNKVWKFTLGALLSSMADMVSTLPHVSIFGHRVPPWDALANGITQIDNYVLEAIGTGIQQTEKGLHALIGAMAWLLQETADQVAGLAEDTAKAFDYMKRILIPALLGAALAKIVREVAHLGGKLRTVVVHPVTAVHKTVQVIAPGLKALEGKVSALEAKVAAIGAAAPAVVTSPAISITLPNPAAIPGDIYRGIDSLKRGFGTVVRTLTPAGIVGLVAGAVLSTLKMPWLKCRNVDKAGRALCGMNADVLEGLLLGVLSLFGTFSLVEFGKYLIPIVDVVGGEVTHFWRADVAGQSRDRAIGSPTLTAL